MQFLYCWGSFLQGWAGWRTASGWTSRCLDSFSKDVFAVPLETLLLKEGSQPAVVGGLCIKARRERKKYSLLERNECEGLKSYLAVMKKQKFVLIKLKLMGSPYPVVLGQCRRKRCIYKPINDT